MAGMDVTIINTMTDDYNKQNAVAVGLASGTSNIELPNLSDGIAVVNGWTLVKAGTTFDNATQVNSWSQTGVTNSDFTLNAPTVTVNRDIYACRMKDHPNVIYLTLDPNYVHGDATPQNIKIDASDGLSPGELYAVGRSASNTETKDQALTITPQKMDSVLKSIERDAKA